MMENPPAAPAVVFASAHRKPCFDARLVLASAGIAAEVQQNPDHPTGSSETNNTWQLRVRPQDLAAAQAELDAYNQELRSETRTVRTNVTTFSGAGLGVFLYACVLVSVYLMDDVSAYGWAWSSHGRLRAGDVMSGQWWQTVTALTLHADTAHLGSNLLFGIGFGFLVGRILGGGVGWLFIVTAGALGNALNAALRSPEHQTIGASTAVFAALGILVAHALRPRSSIPESPMRRWSPLIAGVLLLALIGVGGERTDVLAHVTGFLAGMLLGWAGCRIPDRWLATPAVQAASGAIALSIIIVGWVMAIIQAR